MGSGGGGPFPCPTDPPLSSLKFSSPHPQQQPLPSLVPLRLHPTAFTIVLGVVWSPADGRLEATPFLALPLPVTPILCQPLNGALFSIQTPDKSPSV